MFSNFEVNFINNMAQAGYSVINAPVFLPFCTKISLWGKMVGSMAYYYVLYDISSVDFSVYQTVKEEINKNLSAISERNNLRHSVIFNIFACDNLDAEVVRVLEKKLGSAEEFALMPLYDIYYGIDTSNCQIMRNSKQPDNMDGSLDKIKAALAINSNETNVNKIYALPVTKSPFLIYIIMGINLALFVLMEFDGGSTSTGTLVRYGGAAYHLVFVLGEYHRLVTPIFLHIGVTHLLFNTTSLIIFGIRAEKYFGHIKFLIIYLASGIAGNLAIIFTERTAVGAGASGSIFGLIGALFAFTKLRKKNVENFNAGTLGVMIIVGIFMGFGMSNMPGIGNIGHAAHIGGLVVGFILGFFLAAKKNKKEVE